MGDDSFTLYGSGDEQVAGTCSDRGRAGEGNLLLSPGEGNGMPLPAPAGFLHSFFCRLNLRPAEHLLTGRSERIAKESDPARPGSKFRFPLACMPASLHIAIPAVSVNLVRP